MPVSYSSGTFRMYFSKGYIESRGMLPQDYSKNQRIEIWKWDGLFWHSFFSMFGLRDREGSNNFLHTTTNLHNPYLVAEWIHFTLFGDNMTHYN